MIWRHLWQELWERVLNYLICQGCCRLAAFPNPELRRRTGKVVVIVRGPIPCWICHRAKMHQGTSEDVTLNVIFNWKINKKWHCPKLQINRTITAVSDSMLSKMLFIKLSERFGAMRSCSFTPPRVTVPEENTVLSFRHDKWSMWPQSWRLRTDSYWYHGVIMVFQ